ncbi:MAG: hypothetical protein IBX70_09005 [Clostridia bacterium]|nr:hypothetical protein [Clostridia bacterium]
MSVPAPESTTVMSLFSAATIVYSSSVLSLRCPMIETRYGNPTTRSIAITPITTRRFVFLFFKNDFMG